MEQVELLERLQHRLNLIEVSLCDNLHLRLPENVQALLNKIIVHRELLSEADAAYVDSAQNIITNQIPYDGS